MNPSPAQIVFAEMVAENNRQRFLVRRAAARRRQQAGRAVRPADVGGSGVHKAVLSPRSTSWPSEPSGQTVDWRVSALALMASVVVLPIALVGYIGIVTAVRGWQRLRGRG